MTPYELLEIRRRALEVTTPNPLAADPTREAVMCSTNAFVWTFNAVMALLQHAADVEVDRLSKRDGG